MKCHANKSWLTEEHKPIVQQSDEEAYTWLQIALVFCSALIIVSIVVAFLPSVEVDDHLVSPDMQSYMETVAHTKVFSLEDMQ
jgi:hypothetical protein